MTDAKKKLQEGWIHVLVTFEIIGQPKEYVDESLKTFLETIKADKRIEFIEEHTEPAIEAQEGFFSAFSEVDMLVKDFETMTWLAVNYSPASIEVIEPAHFKLTSLDIQNMQNDMLSVIHTISFQHKQQTNLLEHLKEQFQALIFNIIILSLARGPKKLPELSKDTSLTDEALKSHIEHLVTEKKIVEKKGVYSLA